jgi:hypothetical protein
MESYTALGFSSVRELLRAGGLLRDSGFSVIAVPRRIKGCGVLLLIESTRVEAARTLLAGNDLEPAEATPYPLGNSEPPENEE